ncbi:glycosyltransferase [Neptunomonas japonica]|uniref:glycosyltransferase n=1 Tax=Neptunomonas japonica TaxID=417574 RepID=UPI00041D197C|nr:glycosyltransferase [Neptunomonas japonica]
MINKRVLIVGPSLEAKGGVALYYSIVFPLLKLNDRLDVEYFSIGSSTGRGSIFDILFFIKTLFAFRPDMVHVNTSLGWKSFLRDGLFLLIARVFSCKRLVFFRGWSLSDKVTEGFVFQFYFRLCYKSSNGFCVLSDHIYKKISGWGVKGKIFKQTTVVDKSLFKQDEPNISKCFPDRIDKLKLLFLSRVEKQKGIYELVSAVKILNESGYSVSLTIAGNGGELDVLKNKVSELNINEFIEFVGFVELDDKSNLLKCSDVFCLPSYTEGMPNAVLEAMCFGLPIISTPVGALKDLVTDNVGITVPVKSIDPLVTAIKFFFERDNLTKISNYNSDFANNNFLSDKVTNKLIAVYEDVL